MASVPALVVQLDLSQLEAVFAHLASIVEECGEHDQPCCAALRKEFTNALRCAGVPRALKEITERAAKVDVAAELPAAVEASDADTDTPHRIESER
jgi:hypothetical protein